MDYAKKLNRMDEHLREHPHDYQTVISRLKVASDAYDYQMKKRKVQKIQRILEVRKRLEEEDRLHGKK